MKIGNREFDTENNTYIMGILNITPDSFSDGGRFTEASHEGVKMSRVLSACEDMIASGADIIDVGGESTRPGADPVSATEEMERVIPVIEAIARRFDTVISVDTYKAEVAREAVRAGARLVNDIWGLKGDKLMPAAMGEIMRACEDAALCIMHNRRPVTMRRNADAAADSGSAYEGTVPATMHGEDIDYGYRRSEDADIASDEDLFIEDVRADLAESLKLAADAGIDMRRVILDPGVGFAKTAEQNLAVIRRIGELKKPGADDLRTDGGEYPILLGCSRKSVIGRVLDRPVDERLAGTLATTACAVYNGISFVRVHDVRENADVIRMLRAIEGRQCP